MKELPAAEKSSHETVGYERPSEHTGKHCGNCAHVIESVKGVRCMTVKGPIFLSGWCERWEKA